MSKHRPYIGVTGFMTADEVRAAITAYREAWEEFAPGQEPSHDLMVGVLASAKTLAGQSNGYPRRYPRIVDVAHIFDAVCCTCNGEGFDCGNRTLMLVHYASDVPPDFTAMRRLLGECGPRFHGFQFNVTHPSAADLKRLVIELDQAGASDLRVVLQARMPTGADEKELLLHGPFAYGDATTDILLDGSGGKGLLLDVEHVLRNVRYEKDRWSHCTSHPMNFGVAGGLCAETVPLLAPIVREFPDISIDAEGRLRDDADSGGNLDLEKVKAYLRAAVKLFASVQHE